MDSNPVGPHVAEGKIEVAVSIKIARCNTIWVALIRAFIVSSTERQVIVLSRYGFQIAEILLQATTKTA